MIIDCHCHFDMMPLPDTYIEQREQDGNIVIGMTNLPKHFQIGQPHVKGYKYIRLSLGLHPLLSVEGKSQLSLFNELINQTSYIGEIGLDFSRQGIASKNDQIDVLNEVLSSIRGKRKIVSVHSRRAEKELLDLLKRYEIENVVFHWYSGPLNLISSILEQGYYFSVSEAMCISKSGRAIIEKIPHDRVLTETDAPYNEKCDTIKLLEELANIWDVSFNEAETIVERNFRRLLHGLG